MSFTDRFVLLMFLVSTACWSSGHSSNILFVTIYGSISHVYNILPTIEALSSKGHNVTYLTFHVPPSSMMDNRTHVTVLELSDVRDFIEAHEYTSFYQKENMSGLAYLRFFKTITIDACQVLITDGNFQKVVTQANSTSYDVIVMDPIFSECGLSIVWLLNSPPLIYYCPTYLPSWISTALDIPTPFAYIPTINRKHTSRMTFAQRFANVVQNVKLWIVRTFVLVRGTEAVLRERYPSIPALLDIERNVSFVLSNSHSHSVDFSRPSTPYYAEVGGAHCRPAARLPKDLEEFVDGTDDGFVYFALGSYIHSEEMPAGKLSIFVEVFRRLKQRVLWKFHGSIEDLPDNVQLINWAPQQDILGHRRIKAFISHGGQLSVQEAVYHGVPILGMPFIADEFSNIRNLVEKGMSEEINFFDFDVEELHRKLTNLIHDTRFKECALRYSALMQDRPMKAVQTAVYWIEYVIRHKGARHLRFNSNHVNFFQYFLLDVVGSTLLATVLVSFLATLVIRCWFLHWKWKGTRSNYVPIEDHDRDDVSEELRNETSSKHFETV